MHFSELPTRVPVSATLTDNTTIEGVKLIVGGEMIFQTSRRTFLYVRTAHGLIQVCPFHPDITLPPTGWIIEQLSLYPLTTE